MKTATHGEIKMAIASVRTTKVRSVLTMLGIIIGVVSVISVVSIGTGIQNQVKGQVNQLGRDLITVRAGRLVNRTSSGNITGVNIFSGTQTSGSLGNQDLQTVQHVTGVKAAVPLGLVNGAVSVNGQPVSTPVIATSTDLPNVLEQGLAYGQFFSSDTSGQPNVAIIGSNLADALFHEKIPLGRSFNFLGQTFIVQGVFKQFDTNPLSLSTDFNNTIFIPYLTAQTLTSNNTQPYEILAKPDRPMQTSAVVQSITNTLRRAYQNQQQFTVLRQDESLTVTNNIINLLTRLIAGIAAISLLVGGIGIMDVMLVSVAERMHEIGIRKALGATNRQILSQFLIEASVLSVAGGAIGILLSFVVVFFLRVFTSFTPTIPWQIVVIATLVSLCEGIVFGSAPAFKAARKDPIDALRNE